MSTTSKKDLPDEVVDIGPIHMEFQAGTRALFNHMMQAWLVMAVGGLLRSTGWAPMWVAWTLIIIGLAGLTWFYVTESFLPQLKRLRNRGTR